MAPVAGLFGKLPAYGDFVRRGWPDETVAPIDAWLSATMAAVREGQEDFAAWMQRAPMWRGYVPPGRLGAHALHLAVAPSVDRAGRLFPLAAGVAGGADEVWAHAAQAGAAVDTALYDALAGTLDADGIVDRIAAAPVRGGGGSPPDTSAWWLGPDGDPDVTSGTVDAALLERLLGEGQG